MTETLLKDQLQLHREINTNRTIESLYQEVSTSGLISHALESLFSTLAYSSGFLDVSEETQKVSSYITCGVDTSPYHKNESVNLVNIILKKKDGDNLARTLVRFIYKDNAKEFAKFVNDYGATGTTSASDILRRAGDKGLSERLAAFVTRSSEGLATIENEESFPTLEEAYFLALEESIMLYLITGEYQSLDVPSDEFINQLTASLEVIRDDDDNDDDNDKDKKVPHLRVVK